MTDPYPDDYKPVTIAGIIGKSIQRLFKRYWLQKYWKAKTPDQESNAYRKLRKLGLPASYGEIKSGDVREIDCGDLPIHKVLPRFQFKTSRELTAQELNKMIEARLENYEKFKNALEEIEALDSQDFEDGKFLDRLLPDDYLEKWIQKTKLITRKALGYE